MTLVVIRLFDLWFPLTYQMAHDYRHPRYEQFLCWHYANRDALARSRFRTDNPFQEAM